MATKLENLDVTGVDFVPRGANPKANILVTKNEKTDGLLHKLAKALATVFGENNNVVPVEKEALTFSEMLTEHQIYLILDEVRAANCALTRSIESILTDEESTDKAALMNQSLSEFTSAMQGYIQKWGNGQLVGIAKSTAEPDNQTEEEIEVNIDKSKLTAEEKEFLAKIETKAGIIAKTTENESKVEKFDTAVAAVKASGVFDEIGKCGMEETPGNAVTKIAKFADEIMKKNPDMGRVKAEQKAWEQHPELVAEYEAQA